MLERITAEDFESLYLLIKTSFPPTERRTKEGQRALFDTEKVYQVYGSKNEETSAVEAFLAVWELDSVLFLEHFAVDPNLRGKGLGSRLLCELAGMSDKPLCLEVEPPLNDIAKRRIEFYKRNGFFLNEYPYIQPSLAKGQPPIPLMVMTYGHAVDQNGFEKIRDELYKRVYHVEPMPKADGAH
ncbi:MAG: GNAT family N-acetyltransferase [Clostridia bacterium]|nr:GNAT family N-acetyltransferase [Clostridia bacterium]